MLLSPPPAPPIKRKNIGGSLMPAALVRRVKLFPQPVVAGPLPDGTRRLVPPTEVAYGESDGVDTVTKPFAATKSPSSPLEKFTAIPFAAARLINVLNPVTIELGVVASGLP